MKTINKCFWVRRICIYMIFTVFICLFGIPGFSACRVSAASKTGGRLSVAEFAGMLLDSLSIEHGENEGEVKSAAETLGILEERELKDTNRDIRLMEALAMMVRADEYINSLSGNPAWEAHTDFILKYRISDERKASVRYREYLAKAYELGLVKGISDGKYTKTRRLRPEKYLTKKEAQGLLERLANKEKRYKLSPSFVLCRQNGLPANSEHLNCVYTGFENAFYDWEMYFMKLKKGAYGKSLYDLEREEKEETELNGFQELTSYAFPAELSLYKGFCKDGGTSGLPLVEGDITEREKLSESITGYLRAIFNVDYRTLSEDKAEFQRVVVSNSILSQWGEEEGVPEVDDFIEAAKKNKTILEASVIAVDTDNMYACREYLYVRCYVRWRALSGRVLNGTFNELDGLIFTINGGLSDELNLKGVKKAKWHNSYFDVMVKPKNGKIAGTIINDYYHDTRVSKCR